MCRLLAMSLLILTVAACSQIDSVYTKELPMTQIRVAGAQIPVTKNIEANVATIERAIDFAVNQKADILLTPEGSLSGYTHKFDNKAVEDALRRVTAKARQADLGLALGTCFVEPSDKKCYNQIRFYEPNGTFGGFHNKTLTCGSLTDPPEGEINVFAVRPLRTFNFNGLTIGGLICNDLWANPQCTPQHDTHLSQQLSRMGTKIIFHAVNGGRSDSEWSDVCWKYHESNLRMRAKAGKIWIITVDNCLPMDIRCSCPSGVINPNGDWIYRAEPKGEQFFAYTINLTETVE
ncbi:MAG: carbon-nitrogen hydrolase family protein [Planctomycetota bacterium]|nr:MAG: carbon-nitrogen hydrolase family protein [Planctomycetota bacterium]